MSARVGQGLPWQPFLEHGYGWEGGTALCGLWAPFQPVLEGVDVGPVGTDLWLGWEEGLGDQRPGMGGSHRGQGNGPKPGGGTTCRGTQITIKTMTRRPRTAPGTPDSMYPITQRVLCLRCSWLPFPTLLSHPESVDKTSSPCSPGWCACQALLSSPRGPPASCLPCLPACRAFRGKKGDTEKGGR